MESAIITHLQAFHLENRKLKLTELQGSANAKYNKLFEIFPIISRQIEEAEEEFNERAFHPFWDRIEAATYNLAIVKKELEDINELAIRYNNNSNKLPFNVSKFTLPDKKLPDIPLLIKRLNAIARISHKDKDIAVIYGQRKTHES